MEAQSDSKIIELGTLAYENTSIITRERQIQ